ncbi:uncharacterized protein LOC113777312 [Coffea eugenioides]|uniref:uncharacterized protein LOC113777312 n=1 Tax=Coffea eugenioides TaxID=49369 RepID=UPI000F60C0E4|nr:uncharacterized protein LOC113777312 [Coffea eugenioides]
MATATTMAQHVMIESPTMNRRQPLLPGGSAAAATATAAVKDERECPSGRTIGEVAGVTTAECAAVCCCCPCAVMHLLILAVYKVPKGLCKKAWKKNKRKRLLKKKKKNLEENKSGPNGTHHDDDESSSDDYDDNQKGVGVMDAVDLDSEMWDRFYGAGFWRSHSQRED